MYNQDKAHVAGFEKICGATGKDRRWGTMDFLSEELRFSLGTILGVVWPPNGVPPEDNLQMRWTTLNLQAVEMHSTRF